MSEPNAKRGADGERAHPASYELDAAAIGEASPTVLAHLEQCAECRQYAGALANELAGNVLPPLRLPSERAERRGPAARTKWFALGAALLPAAAALLVFVRPAAHLEPARQPDHVLMARRGGVALEPGHDMQFKGGLSMTSIVDRGGRQERVTGEVVLRGKERMRVEVSLDRATPIEVAFLGDDGSFLPMLAPTQLEAGTHLSDDSLGLDTRGDAGNVLVGTPDAIVRARMTGDLSHVLATRVRYATE
jgi:hypothetical protein